MSTDNLKDSPGFLHNLPQLYTESSGRDLLLNKAVMAVSLAYYSNQSRSYDLAVQARKIYGTSILLLNNYAKEVYKARQLPLLFYFSIIFRLVNYSLDQSGDS